MTKHVEIAGAGLAGLSLAVLLAEQGWTVSVHERSNGIREVGAGIYLKPNGLNALEKVGVLDDVKRMGTKLDGFRRLDANGRLIERRMATAGGHIWCIPREHLIQLLHARACSVGVEVRTESTIVYASADGTLTTSDGDVCPADLVVCADGIGSTLRDKAGMNRLVERLTTVATRYLLQGRDFSQEPVMREYWAGDRRVALAPAGEDSTYAYAVCREDDEEALRQPLDVEVWTESFPVLRREFEVLAENSAVQHNYPMVRCTSWRKGKLAIIGDAAHALPPTLGQGANLAMSNALGLSEYLSRADDTESALADWEKEFRPYTETTQKWSQRYDHLTWGWPHGLDAARKPILWALNLPPFSRRIHVADTMGTHFSRSE